MGNLIQRIYMQYVYSNIYIYHDIQYTYIYYTYYIYIYIIVIGYVFKSPVFMAKYVQLLHGKLRDCAPPGSSRPPSVRRREPAAAPDPLRKKWQGLSGKIYRNCRFYVDSMLIL